MSQVTLKLEFWLSKPAVVGNTIPVRLDGIEIGQLWVTESEEVSPGQHKISGEMKTDLENVQKLAGYIKAA